MNKIYKYSLFIFLLLGITQQSYACGGCRDSYLGNELSNEAKNFYHQGEDAIFQSIEELNELLENEILKAEQEALKENKILLKLEQNINLKMKNENFFLKISNQIQNIINHIKTIQ